jgi:hypothetical protein
VRYLRQVTIRNDGGTTALVGSVITLGTDVTDALISLSITADNTNDALALSATSTDMGDWSFTATLRGTFMSLATE